MQNITAELIIKIPQHILGDPGGDTPAYSLELDPLSAWGLRRTAVEAREICLPLCNVLSWYKPVGLAGASNFSHGQA